jgi:putative transposase
MRSARVTGLVTAAAIARVLGVTSRAIRKRAAKEQWPFERSSGLDGHARQYFAATVPPDIQRAIAKANGASVPAPRRSLASADLASLATWQRERMEARLALLAEVDRLTREDGRDERAVLRVVEMAARGELPEHLQRLVPIANARSGRAGRGARYVSSRIDPCQGSGQRALSRSTIYRWLADRARGAAALAPREAPKRDLPPWVPFLMKLWSRPQKPSLRSVVEQLPLTLPPGIEPPGYHAVRRFMRRVSTVELNRGRLGPRALKALKPYAKRDVSGLDPLDVIEMDGHTADFEVAHPAHGGPFRPEITTVIDVKTRLAIGWSAGLAESAHAVMDALRNAIEKRGVPAILYVDRGSGYEAAVMSDAVIGLLARLGIRHERSLPYNSQARGRIERAHRTIWVRWAKTLPTYVGRDMDKEVATKVHKLTRRELTKRGGSLLLPWGTFIERAQAEVDAYNNRPHRGLAKITDPSSGRLRHAAPEEAWRLALEGGFEPQHLEEPETVDLFRPHREVTARRGLVQLFGNSYFHQALADYGGDRVVVAYDMHDASRVWVKDGDGRHICIATWDGHKRDFFPRSVVEQAREQRAAGRARRLEKKLQLVRDEAAGPALEGAPDPSPLTAEEEALAGEALARLAIVAPDPATWNGRPIFQSDAEYLAWMKANPEAVTADDQAWLTERLQSRSWRMLHGFEDVNAAAD